MNSEMKAIVLKKTGGVENLVLQNVNVPTIKENEVLVKVKAISVNPVDYKVRNNEAVLHMIYGTEQPSILGWDIAGVVEAVGSAVNKFKVGDAVFGMVNFMGKGKAYAEYVAAPELHLAKIPDGISFTDAAATTLAALTALQALQNNIKKNHRVLIHAGSGGVGHFAIQIAKHLGAYVITTSSAKNKDFVMQLGADEHIDYRTTEFEKSAKDIDFVLDGIGGDVLIKSVKTVKEGGLIISIPTAPPEIEEAKNKNIKVSGMMVQSNGNDMDTLRNYLERGVIKAHVSKTYSFSEVGKAHLALESGRTVGKIIIAI